jgi:hypothetical protein
VAQGEALGRFPILRRLGPDRVVPRTEGIEGWLWTSTGGTALTALGGENEAPASTVSSSARSSHGTLVRRSTIPGSAATTPVMTPAARSTRAVAW